MKPAWRIVGGVAIIALLVFAENVFGNQLNAFFQRLPGIDKGLHVIEYLLVFLCVSALAGHARLSPHRRALLAIGVGIALSVADELVQNLAPGRNVEVLDVAADWAGLTFGWVLTSRPSWKIAVASVAAAASVATYAAYDTYVTLIDFSRALQYERKHDFVKAREHYLRALQSGMRTPALYNELGWVEVESGIGDPVKAVEYARTAFDMRPEDPDILDTYGWALHAAGRPAEAIGYLEQAHTRNPGIYCIHYHLGVVYLALGRREQAELHLQQQLQLPETREAAFAARALESLRAHP